MKFLSIVVEDIFAYRGRSEIDLSGCTDEQNIVIVQGRNGHGKTSLLNAVKLLFLGADEESVRRVGFGATPLSSKHFVVGQPGRWYGVFNTISRTSGAPARVALEWEDQGRRFRAERSFWPLRNATDYREQLAVTVDGRAIEGKEAQALLQNLLPKEVVPFFFFDGEQIQSLADAEVGREQAEIERLLGLSFVNHITREIDGYSRDKRRAGLPSEVQARIAKAEGDQRTAEARAEAAERARVALEEETADLDRERKRIEADRNRLRGGLSEEDRRRMESRIDLLRHQRERLAREIAEQLPAEAPALANLDLTRRAFAMLEEQLAGTADASLAGRLHRSLPEAAVSGLGTLDPPVRLQPQQEASFRARVVAALAECGVAANAHENPLLASLSPRQVRALRDRFLLWTEGGASKVGTQAGMLRQSRQLLHDELQLRRELDEAEITSEEARQRFALLTTQLESIESAIRDKISEASEHRVAEQQARREAEQQKEIVARLYAEHEQVTRQNRAYQLSRKVKNALDDYRDERRKLIRASVETQLNDRVQLLLGPSQLVKEARLDEHFAISYLDEQGDLIGRHSLSAGMRQLAAMSMLWALKDEADKPLPVIIDTPLGRIDQENRVLLMREYFPKAGNPLILLPTNTELGVDGYAMLGDRVQRRYEIENEGGVSARIVEVVRTAVGASA